MNKRTVNLIKFMPDHIAEINEFKQMCAAEDIELNLLWQKLEDITLNIDMFTMSEEMCARWERFFGVTETALKTLYARRQLIRGYFASQLPYTEKKLRQTLDSMCGNDGYELTITPSLYSVSIGIKLAQVFTEENVRDVARQMIPAHLNLTVSIIFNRWEQFESYTWGSLSSYTWNQILSDKRFQEA